MIFVTVGNATQGFRRLLDAIDEMAGAGELNGEQVVIQSGSNRDFQARNCRQQDYFPPDEFRELIERADVIVCHGGAGTLHNVFQAGKVPVVMPRRRSYGEHVDDQFALVKEIAEQGRIIPAFEPAGLRAALIAANRLGRRSQQPAPNTAISLISEALEQLCTSSA
jgi:UDP-N-acetylglucosamine transferase subunit ALG13